MRVQTAGVMAVVGAAFVLGAAGCCCTSDGSKGTLEREEAEARAAATEGLVGEWVVREIRGEQVGHIAGGEGSTLRLPTMTIEREGRVSGFGGVNRYSGAFIDPTTPVASEGGKRATSGAFELSPLASTKMAGPEGPTRVEVTLFGALDDAATYELNGDALVLKNAEGTEVVRMGRNAK